MLSWNLDDNVGYVLSRDNDVIAHEKTYGVSGSGTDGIICALHGGAGFLNNWAFLNLRIEQAFSLVSIAIKDNPFGTSKQLGSISTILIRSLTVAKKFITTANPFQVSGNTSANARVDNVVFEGVRMPGGRPLSLADVTPGIGQLVTNVSVCKSGCGEAILPAPAEGWSRRQTCGLAPQPAIGVKQLPPLARPDLQPWCAAK